MWGSQKNMLYENRPQQLLVTATPGVGSITYHAPPSVKEEHSINWLFDNLGGEIQFLAEENISGQKNPDLLWNDGLLDIKHTSGNLDTLGKRIQEALRQSSRNGALIDITSAKFTDQEAIDIALSRIARVGGNYVILIRDGQLVAYISE